VRSELGICARIGREAETCPAVAARSEIKDPCPFGAARLPSQCGGLAAHSPRRKQGPQRRETRAGSDDMGCVLWSVPRAFVCIETATTQCQIEWQ
jgi:hypothetical protein